MDEAFLDLQKALTACMAKMLGIDEFTITQHDPERLQPVMINTRYAAS
ncbi:MAG: hypothetical protein MZV64_70480 [Ignavibacteriales bacterium]|nr:hypothetical protein [Ignavibacteriales bacterium]